ncbi:MAG TPA: CBS domain-containing protein [Kofleriaceae bacterium]|nr:CBS domain-containing protein [Kofleriaceae bacterium]
MRLGKRLGYPAFATIPVSAVMLSRVPFVSPQQPLEEVAQMFVAGRTAQVPVVEDGAPVGVVTREDVVAGLERSGPHAPISAAPRHDVVTVTPYDSLADVLERLRHSPRAVAVVVDRGAPVGLVTADLLRSYLDQKLA